MAKEKGLGAFFDWLEKLDKRYLYLVVWLFVILSNIVYLPFPVLPSPPTKAGIDYLNSIPEGGVVIYSCAFRISSWWSDKPATMLVLNNCFKNNLKVILVSFEPDGPTMLDEAVNEILEQWSDKKYGEDIIHFGFFPGFEAAMAAFAGDISSLTTTDYYGDIWKDMPIMEGIEGGKDCQLIVDKTWWIADYIARQFGATYGVPHVYWAGASYGIRALPYYSSGLVKGILFGFYGLAEYETAMDMPGIGVKYLNTVNWGFLYIVLLIILGNLASLYEKLTGRGEK